MDYHILVSRSATRPMADLYAFNLADPIPVVSVPLHADDQEPLLDLSRLLSQIYDQAGFDQAIDYTQPLTNFTQLADIAWVDGWLRSLGY